MTTTPLTTAPAAIQIQEYETAVVPCSAATAAAMHEDGHVHVFPSTMAGHFQIRARHKVGVLRYDNLEIRIVPKVPLARLLYMASFRDDPDAWRETETLLADVDDPLSAIAHAMIFHAERALRPAPLQGYLTHEETSRRIRGRVLFDRQLSARAGVLLPVELRFDEYELATAENRVLRAALQAVSRFVADRGLVRRLHHLQGALVDVAPWPVGLPIPEFAFGRLNQRYKPALAIARLVLERRSLDYPARHKPGAAFLLNMNAVFESFLEAALSERFPVVEGRVVGQHPLTLDVHDSIVMKPDITWWTSGRCRAVIDAKYKRADSTDFPNADAYQMLAYTTRLGLAHGYLVYADLNGQAAGRTTIRNVKTQVVVDTIDISGSIDDLHASVDRLVQTIALDSSCAPL